ncbi:MAG: hypothetical protein PHU07_06225 [Acidocella sp.]|nr:hypothetical protein [Acidocella sp.]
MTDKKNEKDQKEADTLRDEVVRRMMNKKPEQNDKAIKSQRPVSRPPSLGEPKQPA